ncbi:MAG: phosphoglycolate phosphatase [Motiliproteus sp.]
MTNPSPFQQGKEPALVLFDLDGTLIDSVPSLALAIDRMLESLGRAPVGELQVRQWVGNGAAVLVKRALSDSIVVDESLDGALVERALEGFLAAYSQCSSQGTLVYAGVKPFLEALSQRRIPMAVVTNKPLQFVPSILRELQLDGYFQLLVGGDCLTHKKPHPEPLLHAAKHFQVDPQRALMVGDSCNDVKAARRALFPVACVNYGYNHGAPIADSKPDWVVDSLMELL